METEKKKSPPSHQNDEGWGNKKMGPLGIAVMACYMILFSLLVSYLLIAMWPEKVSSSGQNGTAWSPQISLFWGTITGALTSERRLILLVLLGGALGSYVHAATSFADYVGNRVIILSWAWWYILRPFIGMILALIFYVVIRGGLLSTGGDTQSINEFGIIAVAVLAGLFTKQATDKLREVFDTLFRTKEEVIREDSLEEEFEGKDSKEADKANNEDK